MHLLTSASAALPSGHLTPVSVIAPGKSSCLRATMRVLYLLVSAVAAWLSFAEPLVLASRHLKALLTWDFRTWAQNCAALLLTQEGLTSSGLLEKRQKASLFLGTNFFCWFTLFCPVPGPVFGSKDNFHGLAIFLDTYPNDEATEVSSSGSSLGAISSWFHVPSAS